MGTDPRSKRVDATGGYSGTPLAKKLGINPGAIVALIGAPRGFEASLGALPAGVRVHRSPRAKSDLCVWFTTSKQELERGIARMLPRAAQCGLWIAWPKKASGVVTDLSDKVVRDTALARGIVDIKVCAIDPTWSGLRFSERKVKSARA